jgi:hypothetical protein
MDLSQIQESVFELNILENKDKIPIIISIISLLTTIGMSAYFSVRQNSLIQEQDSLSQRLYQLQAASMRANMSIFAFNQNWTFTTDGVFLTINGTLRNEGTREAIVRSMGLSVTYHYSDGTPYTTAMVEYSDLAKYCNIENATVPEKKEISFSISMFIHWEIIAIIGGSYTSNSTSVVIGKARSDNYTVSVTYFDGVGNLQSEQEFSTN